MGGAGPLDGDRASAACRHHAAGAEPDADVGATGAGASAGTGDRDVAAGGADLGKSPVDKDAVVEAAGRGAAGARDGDRGGAARRDRGVVFDIDAEVGAAGAATLAGDGDGAVGGSDGGFVASAGG